jgi:hypothetical protein
MRNENNLESCKNQKIRSTKVERIKRQRKEKSEKKYFYRKRSIFSTPEEIETLIVKTGLLTRASSYFRSFPYAYIQYRYSGFPISSTLTVAGTVLVFHQIPY